MFKIILVCLILMLTACGAPPAVDRGENVGAPISAPVQPSIVARPTRTPLPTHDPAHTPTPDPTRDADSHATELYIVQSGDTVAGIAAEYNTTIDDIALTNSLDDLTLLHPGDPLNVPLKLDRVGPATKLIPDAELVNGPSAIGFEVAAFVEQTNGYLKTFSEQVDGVTLSGAQIVERVAQQFSVNPRLLLAVLEFRGGWLSNPAPGVDAQLYPVGYRHAGYQSLYLQLSYAANNLNDGYYGWKYRAQQTVRFIDFSRALIAKGLNAGTVGVQTFLARDRLYEDWLNEIGPEGFGATYEKLFGDPFNYSIELLPPDLTQPVLTLPWAPGEMWYYTGGPHGAWVSGSGWAAIDFIPNDPVLSCWPSDQWALAVAPGQIVRSENGEVVQDLGDDGDERTGWSIFYMHVAGEGRVAVGTRVNTGDPIGHPSCEGGLSTATHLHLARKYNGEWLPAAGPLPMVLDGWKVTGEATEYDGGLVKGNQIRVACECREDGKNGVVR